MNKILTATFESEEALKTVEDNIVNAAIAGIPREKIFVNREKKEIKVIFPAETAAQIRKIFENHNPKNVTEAEWKE